MGGNRLFFVLTRGRQADEERRAATQMSDEHNN